jgi:MFS family permease
MLSRQKALYIAGFSAYASSSIVFPIIAPYAILLGGTEAEAGIIAGAFALTTSLTMIPLGLLADRYGRLRIMVLGMLIFILTPFFYALAGNFFELLVVRLFHGLAMALFVPASNAMAIDLSPRKRGEALGWIATFTMLGYASGPVMGGFVASIFGYIYTFYFCSLVALMGSICLLFLRGSEGMKPSFEFRLKPQSLNAVGAIATPFFATFGSAVIGIFAIPLYLPNFGVDVRVVGTLTTALFLSSAIVRVPAGKLSDSIGRRPVILLGLGLEAIGILAFLSSNLFLMMIASVITGLGMGVANPAGFALMSDLLSPKMRGFAMGASSTSLQFGVFLGPAIMGFVSEAFGYPTVFLFTAFITLNAALLIFILTSEVIDRQT